MKSVKNSSLEFHRRHWKKVAKENGWDRDPFFVQIWIDKKGRIRDSVSYTILKRDIFLDYDEEYELTQEEWKERVGDRVERAGELNKIFGEKQ